MAPPISASARLGSATTSPRSTTRARKATTSCMMDIRGQKGGHPDRRIDDHQSRRCSRTAWTASAEPLHFSPIRPASDSSSSIRLAAFFWRASLIGLLRWRWRQFSAQHLRQEFLHALAAQRRRGFHLPGQFVRQFDGGFHGDPEIWDCSHITSTQTPDAVSSRPTRPPRRYPLSLPSTRGATRLRPCP